MNSNELKLPALNIKHRRSKTYTIPFSKAKYEMGDLKFWVNTESSDIWKQNPNHKYSKAENKDKYLKVITSNPSVFYRKSGICTNYIDFSIKYNKVGPFVKKN
ncbi:hypothetical protein SteCoe_25144 [Stentor coeruleus]|uniref:Uncharacterized protein n=1 Tax=Stentor coeruleus TaxID=5963 RepID=A0A1R2BG20_9CILI|nr:hypothetical protein SteCoe_25144 [Stentor coeruleus]